VVIPTLLAVALALTAPSAPSARVDARFLRLDGTRLELVLRNRTDRPIVYFQLYLRRREYTVRGVRALSAGHCSYVYYVLCAPSQPIRRGVTFRVVVRLSRRYPPRGGAVLYAAVPPGPGDDEGELLGPLPVLGPAPR
jgi:hypothetical protein